MMTLTTADGASITLDDKAITGFRRTLRGGLIGNGPAAYESARRVWNGNIDRRAPSTVRAEGGVTWRELDHEAQAFGLATTGGTVSNTGIAGLTLGGGAGWLMGKHGLAIDNLISVDIVTADGTFRKASAGEHPDLFWALCGGGGNFRVVTSLEYRLHDVPEVLGGLVLYPWIKPVICCGSTAISALRCPTLPYAA